MKYFTLHHPATAKTRHRLYISGGKNTFSADYRGVKNDFYVYSFGYMYGFTTYEYSDIFVLFCMSEGCLGEAH